MPRGLTFSAGSRYRSVTERVTGGGVDPAATPKGSNAAVLTFVEEQSDNINIKDTPQEHLHHYQHHQHQQQHQQHEEETLTMLRGGKTAPVPQQRGLRIPYSPGGKRGSLTTGALSPPVTTPGGARRQSSLKSDLRV